MQSFFFANKFISLIYHLDVTKSNDAGKTAYTESSAIFLKEIKMRNSRKNNKSKAAKANVKMDYTGNMVMNVGKITVVKEVTNDGVTTKTTCTMEPTTIKSEGNILTTIKAFKDIFMKS